MFRGISPNEERICAAEVIAALSLATDLTIGFDFEHGLRSTLVAARLAERLGGDRETTSHTYYACLLQQVGCTADAHVRAAGVGDFGSFMEHFMPVWFGAPREMVTATSRAVAPDASLPVRAIGHRANGSEGGARDAAPGRRLPRGRPKRVVGGAELAARVVGERAGDALDPAIASRFVDEAEEILAIDDEASVWEQTPACEPAPRFMLEGAAIDRALSAIGDFADLVSPYLAGHSAGVAELAGAAAQRCEFDAPGVTALRRAALVHDVGRVAVPIPIWQKRGTLTAGDWERVRLHPYHSERVLSRSPFLAALSPVAPAHHERLDGSGYHRGAVAGALSSAARLLPAADAYHRPQFGAER